MKIEKYLYGDETKSLIQRFAFLGNPQIQINYFKNLADLAEYENWTSSEADKEYDILYNYIIHTFSKSAHEDSIFINDNESLAIFNTGLLTENGEDILGVFNEFKNSNDFHWHLGEFRKSSDLQIMENFDETPKVVSYFEDPSKIYFDPNKVLIKNLDHILDENITRFPESMQQKGKQYINALLTNAIDITIKRCHRNYRIAVPQYYKDKITYLLPVQLEDTMMSLAVEEINNRYRANTIFTLDMAYKHARLLMKPEADWLTLGTKKEAE
ncbi:DUF3825 domain-containing protein (plasmid) [Macrococcoides bohemicum]|uniref:DUF3825 domain-containing protein n=1 Tax=Macrococcoides bohemicum TaxID=1903056 RepID=UPI003AFFAE1C